MKHHKENNKKIMEVQNLCFSFSEERKIFHDVSFSVYPGEVISILGPNGAGKSTLLNCIASLLTPDSGDILFNGNSIKTMSIKDVSRCVGYVPQNHFPAYSYSVRDFVVMGRTPHMSMFAQPKEEDYRLVHDTLKQMGILHLANKPYTEISGGERQQVIIARAILQQPQIILFDEPTAHLDFGNQVRIIKMIKNLSSQGFAILMTTHTPDHVIMLGDRVGILDRSGKMTFGSIEDIMREDILSAVYNTDLKLVYVKEIGRLTCVATSCS
jgi:iron complex transport system ATP-binding protein